MRQMNTFLALLFAIIFVASLNGTLYLLLR